MERLTNTGTKEAKESVTIREVIYKLAEYEDLEEKGLLLRLPCKVGDTVFILVDLEGNSYTRVKVDIVKNFYVDKDGVWAEFEMIWHDQPISEFGKSIFLTREEAEAALLKMEMKTS